jgi:drug/metabolite transporter (DMT)-like permease
MMTGLYAGELAALATALCWTAAVMIFEGAGRRMGSLPVNLLRLLIGLLLLCLLGAAGRGHWLPTDAGAHAWLWLSLSGLCGLTLGDLCLFRAFVVVGARISMLVMSFAPALAAITSYLFLGEALSAPQLAGMTLTTAGICLVVLKQGAVTGGGRRYPLSGLLLALGGALGQAGGMVLSKIGMGSYNAFAANQIRLIAGLAGLTLFLTLTRQWPPVMRALIHSRRGVLLTAGGAVFGPSIGISLSLYAVQHTRVGVAAAIIGMVPILIIPPAVIWRGERVGVRDVTGALIAVAGTLVLFWWAQPA